MLQFQNKECRWCSRILTICLGIGLHTSKLNFNRATWKEKKTPNLQIIKNIKIFQTDTIHKLWQKIPAGTQARCAPYLQLLVTHGWQSTQIVRNIRLRVEIRGHHVGPCWHVETHGHALENTKCSCHKLWEFCNNHTAKAALGEEHRHWTLIMEVSKVSSEPHFSHKETQILTLNNIWV